MSAAGGVETEDDASEAANEEERGEDEGARAIRRVVDEGGWGVAPEVVRVRERRGVPGVGRRRRARGVSKHAKHISCERTGGREGARSLLAARENDGASVPAARRAARCVRGASSTARRTFVASASSTDADDIAPTRPARAAKEGGGEGVTRQAGR